MLEIRFATALTAIGRCRAVEFDIVTPEMLLLCTGAVAYSYSDSESSRYGLLVIFDSHVMYCCASSQFT
jgi:hypothetical protein